MNTRVLFLLFLVAIACSPNPPAVSGRWTNKTKQLLVIEEDLSGRLTQEARCSPQINVTIHRDPLDAYSIVFNENQPVYFPVVQRPFFEPNEFFCASKDSTPMCNFCLVQENNSLDCEETEQKISGRGGLVTHDCTWTRVTTTTTSTSSMGCPVVPDAGAGCRAINTVIDPSPDAGVRD